MNLARVVILAIFLMRSAHGEEFVLETTPLVESSLYNQAHVTEHVTQRIEAGVYDGYVADLCVDEPSQCEADAFKPFLTVVDGQNKYLLTIQKDKWTTLPSLVKDAAIREIIYFSWGHSKRQHSPLDVAIKGDPLGASPLAHLSAHSASRYLRFASPESMVGGIGLNAYAPNCWYNALSAIADSESDYAKARFLVPASWDRARFMGPTEFRQHMKNFTQVSAPRFGDIVRYYTDDPIYGGFQNLVFGGEVHAAVYVGKSIVTSQDGKESTSEIALTKNGRSDLDFLIFQDIRGMDEAYLPPPDSTFPEGTQVKKAYFRANRGAAILDPAIVGRRSNAHGGHLVDIKNYTDRWLCLSGLLSPPSGEGKTCYSYPVEWMTLPADEPTESESLKVHRAKQLSPIGTLPSTGSAMRKPDG